MLPSLLLHRVLATIALLKFQLQVTAASVAYIKHLRASVDGPRYTVCAQLATKNQGQVVTVESGEAYTILREKHWYILPFIHSLIEEMLISTIYLGPRQLGSHLHAFTPPSL